MLRDILQGALHVWRVDGVVSVAGDACAIRTGTCVVTVARVTEDGEAPYWNVTRENGPPPQPCAGIHGMLRAVRDAVDPASAAGRLVVGGGP